MITVYRPMEVKPFYPAVLDIETASTGEVLAIEYGYTNEDNERIFKVFTSWGDFLTFICKLINSNRTNRALLHRITRIWAHNGANFDYLSLIEYIRDNDLAKDTQYIISGSTGIGVVIKLRSKETIRLYDSNRLLPGSLDKLCKEFKTETRKLDVPKKYKSKMQLFLAKYPELFYEYLHNDVASLQEVIYTFWTMIYELEGTIGYLPMTLPSLALRIFRMGLDEDFVITVPWNEEVRHFSRRSYTGGRVECYQSGEHKQIRAYDVNSMYPAVMASNVYPSSARAAWTHVYRTDLLGLWEIEYEQTNTSIPAVLRDETSAEFSYKGSGVYTNVEIELLKEVGGSVQIKIGCVFQRSTKLFEKFVSKYYELKRKANETGNTALAFVAKILMNSLYGKFGQHGVKQQIEQTNKQRVAEVIANGGTVHILSDDYMVTQENEMVEHEFVAIATFVTSYARIVLYRYILAAGSDYVYSDTDSVHVKNNKVIETGDKLGQMKLEKTGTGIYLGRKLYSIKSRKGNYTKAKGIGRAIKSGKLNHNAMKRLLDREMVAEFTFDVFPTVKEVLSRSRPSCVMFQRTRRIKRLK